MVWGLIMPSETLEVILWARKTAKKHEVVQVFWDELCKAVNQESTASAEKVYSELRLYGSNTALKLTRPEGVEYHEVAEDVADKLAPFLKSSPYGYSTIDDCERYVLEKMEVSEDDIKKICSSIDGNGGVVGKAGVDVNGKAIAVVVVSAVVVQIARVIATRIATMTAGFVVGLLLTIVTIAAPAYRCTIPGVTYVALLRKLYAASKRGI
jgi:uncharacterized protein YaaW (UPF0174 family)